MTLECPLECVQGEAKGRESPSDQQEPGRGTIPGHQDSKSSSFLRLRELETKKCLRGKKTKQQIPGRGWVNVRRGGERKRREGREKKGERRTR